MQKWRNTYYLMVGLISAGLFSAINAHISRASQEAATIPSWAWLINDRQLTQLEIKKKSAGYLKWLVQKLNVALDVGSCMYAAREIYLRYKMMEETVVPRPTGILKRSVGWCVDWFVSQDTLASLHKKTLFMTDAVSIVAQTLMYKTLARLVLVCATGDVFDAAEEVFIKGKRLALILIV